MFNMFITTNVYRFFTYLQEIIRLVLFFNGVNGNDCTCLYYAPGELRK